LKSESGIEREIQLDA